jgi:hydrogenase maturation protease
VTVRPQRVLVAGLGNIFLGDDAFGVEVVRRLSVLGLPDEVRVIDVGIRSVHLAYELRERTYDSVILIDVVSKGGEAGTLYVLEPDDDEDTLDDRLTDGHTIHPREIFALVRQLGGRLPRMILVGCEPFRIGPDAGLSPRVAAAVDDAVALVTRLASAVVPLMAVRT